MANHLESIPPSVLADRLVLAAVRLTRRLRAEDPAPRLSGPEASALAIVVHAGEIRPSDLARLEEVRRPTIARVIAGLERRGLVRRRPDPEDGRVAWITATPEGAAIIAEGQARRIGPLVRDLETLEPAETARLAAALPILERLSRPT